MKNWRTWIRVGMDRWRKELGSAGAPTSKADAKDGHPVRPCQELSVADPVIPRHEDCLKHMDPKTGEFLTSEKEFYAWEAKYRLYLCRRDRLNQEARRAANSGTCEGRP